MLYAGHALGSTPSLPRCCQPSTLEICSRVLVYFEMKSREIWDQRMLAPPPLRQERYLFPRLRGWHCSSRQDCVSAARTLRLATICPVEQLPTLAT